MLKATEAFNKIKKQNDELKQQLGSESQYQEPLKNENHKIVAENNQLHLDVIRLKEELEYSAGDLRHKVK
jgi:regulator of replication initiation timing